MSLVYAELTNYWNVTTVCWTYDLSKCHKSMLNLPSIEMSLQFAEPTIYWNVTKVCWTYDLLKCYYSLLNLRSIEMSLKFAEPTIYRNVTRIYICWTYELLPDADMTELSKILVCVDVHVCCQPVLFLDESLTLVIQSGKAQRHQYNITHLIASTST